MAREADKIVSLKEDMDAVVDARARNRQSLPEGVDGGRARLAGVRARVHRPINRSLYTRLGIDPEPSSSRVMASGIEVIEGGLAEAAIEEEIEGGRRPPIVAALVDQAGTPWEEPSEIDFQAAGVQAECDLVAKNDPDEATSPKPHQRRGRASLRGPVQAPVPTGPLPPSRRSRQTRSTG